MAKLYIPQVGDKLKLIENWNCKIFNEYRNEKVFNGLNIESSTNKNTNIDITFPKGTVLRVERLYVRAPASSFDNITFRIDSCPIKSLNKARFWVKLMDANNIQFEEIINSIDSYTKLKDCYTFVALSNQYQNSNDLSDEEIVLVNKEIFTHFNNKNKNLIKITCKLTPEDVLKTIIFENVYRHNNKEFWNENLTKIKQTINETEVTIEVLPVLDGLVLHMLKNDDAIKINKVLDLEGKFARNYYNKNKLRLGSIFSYDNYSSIKEKNTFPSLFTDEMIGSAKIEYQGEMMKIKDLKELNKLIKKIRI